MFKVDAFVYFLINLAQLLVNAFAYIHYNKQSYLQRITYNGFVRASTYKGNPESIVRCYDENPVRRHYGFIILKYDLTWS